MIVFLLLLIAFMYLCSKARDYQNIEIQQESTIPQQWLIKEAERRRNAKMLSMHMVSAEQKQKHRRSVPNMNQIMDPSLTPHIFGQPNYQNLPNQYTNYQNVGYVNQLTPTAEIGNLVIGDLKIN